MSAKKVKKVKHNIVKRKSKIKAQVSEDAEHLLVSDDFKKYWKEIKKRRLRKRKSSFNFGSQRCAYLYLRKTFSNVFVTLTDFNNKVILCCTSGSSTYFRRKRQKTFPKIMEAIASQLVAFLKLYDVDNINIILKNIMTSHLRFLLRTLLNESIKVNAIQDRIPFVSTFLRGRRIRRI